METANFLIGLAAIGLFGFATQRGGACAVASIVEVVSERRPGRLLALVETSVLIGLGLSLLSVMGLLPAIPNGYVMSASTAAGGAVLGIGAFYNRSCAIGTVARIGAGQWAYLATPVGFFLGSAAASRITSPQPLTEASVIAYGPSWLALLGILLVLFRLLANGWNVWRAGSGPLRYIWSPHAATTISGLAFLAAFLTVGGWTYTEMLGEIARGETVDALREFLLSIALIAGAVLGGWTAGLRPKVPKASRIGRCFVGGGLMGFGAAIIPGGSDGLILVGMPLLWPYAWLAFASMCATIYVAVRVSSRK